MGWASTGPTWGPLSEENATSRFGHWSESLTVCGWMFWS